MVYNRFGAADPSDWLSGGDMRDRCHDLDHLLPPIVYIRYWLPASDALPLLSQWQHLLPFLFFFRSFSDLKRFFPPSFAASFYINFSVLFWRSCRTFVSLFYFRVQILFRRFNTRSCVSGAYSAEGEVRRCSLPLSSSSAKPRLLSDGHSSDWPSRFQRQAAARLPIGWAAPLLRRDANPAVCR